jgi:hypothetical protein
MAVDLTKINAINQRAQQLLQKPVATVTPTPIMSTPLPRQSITPTPTPKMSPLPIPQSTPVKPNLFQRVTTPVKNVAQSAMRGLQIPSEMTEKGLTGLYGKTNYEDVYRQNRVPEFAVKPLAFGARMVLDPLNAVPFLKGGKILSKLGKVTGITKKVAPLVSKAKNWLNPTLNLPEDIRTLAEMIPGSVRNRTIDYVEKMQPIVKGMSTAGREAAAKMLQGTDDANDAFMALKATERPMVDTFVAEISKQRPEQIKRAVELGLSTKKAGEKLLSESSTYYHATDFEKYADKKGILKKMFSGIKTATTYLRKKTGAKGFSLDAPIVMAKREIKQFFDEEKAKVLLEVKKNVEYAIKTKGKLVPEGFVKVAGDDLKGHRMLKGYAVRQDIYDGLIKSEEIGKGLFGKLIVSGGDVLNEYNKLWKPLVTGYNPAFHFQNLLGNVSQIALAGVRNPKRFLQAIVGNIGPLKTISKEEQLLAKTGKVLNEGQVMESLGKELGDVSELGNKGILQKIGDSKINPFYWLQRGGKGIENNARTALYNDAYQKALKTGKTAAEASMEAFRQTNKYLFNYAKLGPREKLLRSYLPFYSWSRFNMPLQIQELLKQPSFFAASGKLSRTMEPERGGMPGERGYTFPMPSWLKDSSGKNVRTGPNMPWNTLFDIAQPGNTAKNMASPALKDSITIAGNLMGAETGTYKYGGFTGPPILPPGFSPEGKIKQGILPWIKERLRPFKDIESSVKMGGLAGWMKEFFGTLQSENPQQDILNQVYGDLRSKNANSKEFQGAINQGDMGAANRLRSKR